MRVAQRLFLAVLPAILGLLAVAALAYWGRFHRTAPEWVVVAAAVAALGSLVLAWQNTRYVARRIEGLARVGRQPSGRGRSTLRSVRDAALPRPGASLDELDSIEEVVDRLSGAVTAAESDSRRREAAASERVQEYAALLAETTSAVSRQVDEIRLPLQILLENHFGPLTENQEEMLAAARLAADAAVVELQRLREIASLDQGALTVRRDPIQLGDVLRGLLPLLKTEGEPRGVAVELELAPGLPRVAGDRARLQQATQLLLRHIVGYAEPGRQIRIEAARDEETGGVAIDVHHGATALLGAEIALARRLFAAHRGTLELGEDRSRLRLPSYHAPERTAGARAAP